MTALEFDNPVEVAGCFVELIVNDGIGVFTAGFEDFPPPWGVFDEAIEETSVLGNVEIERFSVGLSETSKGECIKNLALAIADFRHPGLHRADATGFGTSRVLSVVMES